MRELVEHNLGLFLLFNAIVLGMLAFDLGVLNKKSHTIHLKEAVIWTIVWIVLALGFGGLIYFTHGPSDALTYITAYLIEKALSVDNIFVFIIIFVYFDVPQRYQHKVLFWGIIGAFIMRAVLIFAGIAMIERWRWLIYVLGVFLIFTGIKAAVQREKPIIIEKNPMLKFLQRYFRITKEYDGDKFLTKRNGLTYLTPLVVVLILVETTDLIFALDSIPAILAISTDPFIVYTSNVFAILGLRALYFVVADMIQLFRYLRIAVCAVLVLVGVKMVLSDFVHLSPPVALGLVVSILSLGIIASLLDLRKRRRAGVA